MFSRILIKLIDEAIIPALVLLTTRFVSVLVVSKYFGINTTFGSAGFIFPSQGDFVLINTYSVLSILVVVVVALFYILLKAFIFHESHITPHLTAKLFSLRLQTFIQNSFDLYSQGAVWLSYIYLLTLVSFVMALMGAVYPFVFYTSLVLTILSTVILIFDVENELEIQHDKSLSQTHKEVVGRLYR